MSDVTDGSKETDSAPLRHGMNTVAPSKHVMLSARIPWGTGEGRSMRYRVSAKVRGRKEQGVERKLKLRHRTITNATDSEGAHQPQVGGGRTYKH